MANRIKIALNDLNVIDKEIRLIQASNKPRKEQQICTLVQRKKQIFQRLRKLGCKYPIILVEGEVKPIALKNGEVLIYEKETKKFELYLTDVREDEVEDYMNLFEKNFGKIIGYSFKHIGTGIIKYK